MNSTTRTTVLILGVTLGALAASATWAIAAPDRTEANGGTSASAGQSPGESGIPDEANAATQTRAAVPSARTAGRLRRTFSLPVRQPVFFITIDDGVTRNMGALNFVLRHRIPVTVFLTASQIKARPGYFAAMASQGGSVENHTLTHPVLPSVSTGQLINEVCGPQRWYQQSFGRMPTMLRPPYGEGGYSPDNSAARLRIDSVATRCGLRHMVMWNALAEDGKFQFIRGSLQRGDIVLFHFTPWLDRELHTVMAMATRKGLRPAALINFLP